MPNTGTCARIPPSNIEAEKSVIAALLKDNLLIDSVSAILPNEEYFYHYLHQNFYAAILNLRQHGKPADLVTVYEWLKANRTVELPTDTAYLADLWDNFFVGGNAEHYAGIVREKALLRKIIHACGDILTNAFDPSYTIEALLDQAESLLSKIATNSGIDEVRPLKEFLEESYRGYEKAHAGMSKGIPYGLADLDDRTGGMHPEEFIILAARPGIGKTALAIQVAANVAGLAISSNQTPVYIASLEQSGTELAGRLLCNHCRVNSHRWRMGAVDSGGMDRISFKRHELEALSIYVNDRPQTLGAIISSARRLYIKKKIGLVVIDYLQLIDSEDRRVQRHLQVDEMSRRLKLLAKELKIPVLCLAQLNRECEENANHRPKLHNLRESGGVEQNADTVLFLYCPEEGGPINLDIAKQRHGPTGVIELAFQKEFFRFENFENSDYATETKW